MKKFPGYFSLRLLIGIGVVVVVVATWWFVVFKRDSPEPARPDDQVPQVSEEKGPVIGGKVTEPKKSVFDNLSASKDYSTFLTAMQTSGLVPVLQSTQKITIFVPSNTAFGKLSRDTLQAFFKPENKNELQELLNMHVVPGKYQLSDFKDGMKLKTIQGEELTVTQKEGKWWVNNVALIETPDIFSANGVIHTIDAVITTGEN